MSGVVKPITKKIVKMYKSGMDVPEIIRSINGTYPQVTAALKRAQERGEIPINKEKPPITNVEALRRRYDIKTGGIGEALAANASPEVWVFAAEHTINNGYGSMAEYLIDLLVEAYYEQGGAE
jgi:DNA-binding MarR family transcriptional regulator